MCGRGEGGGVVGRRGRDDLCKKIAMNALCKGVSYLGIFTTLKNTKFETE